MNNEKRIKNLEKSISQIIEKHNMLVESLRELDLKTTEVFFNCEIEEEDSKEDNSTEEDQEELFG